MIIAEILILKVYCRSPIKLFTLQLPQEQNLYRVFASSCSLHPSLLAFVQKYHVLLLSIALTGFLRTKNDAFIGVFLKYYQGIINKSSRRVLNNTQKKSAEFLNVEHNKQEGIIKKAYVPSQELSSEDSLGEIFAQRIQISHTTEGKL